MMDFTDLRTAGPALPVRPTARPSSALEAFEDHRLELERYVAWRTRDPEDAAEIVQEAFLRLIREEQAGRRPDVARAWLFRVAANLATSRARHRTVVERSADRVAWTVPLCGSPEDDLARREDLRRVRLVLANLSADARTALLLAAEGYHNREIGERIGRSEAATRTLLCRARGRARELLEAADAAERRRADLVVHLARRGVVAAVTG